MAKKKAAGDWRAQRLAAYKTMAVMAGNLSGTFKPLDMPKYTAKPSGSTTSPAAQYWADKNNTGLGAIAAGTDPTTNAPNENKRGIVAKVLDALSVGAYATAGAASAGADETEKMVKEGNTKVDSVDDVLRVMGAQVKGMGKGAKSAFNDDKKITWKDNIDRFVKAGVDAGEFDVDQNSTGYKVASAVGGFAGDVFLDPTTYIPGVALTKLGKLGKIGKGAGEFLNTSETTTKFAKGAEKTAKARPKINAAESAASDSKELVPTGAGRTDKFSGPGIPAAGFNVPDASKYKLTYPEGSSMPSGISANAPNPAVGELGQFQKGIDPTVIKSTIEDNLPRNLKKDAPDTTGATIREAAEKTTEESISKNAKKTEEAITEINNLADVLHNAKYTNPALDTKMKFADWTTKAKNGDYSPEQLQPFFDYHKVDNVDDLVDAMKGKNYKATVRNIRDGMRQESRQRVFDNLPGSSASVADRMADATLDAEKLVEGSLDNVKPDLVRFSDPAIAKTADDLSRQVLGINVKYPARSGKPAKTKHRSIHYRNSSQKSVTYLGSNNIMDQSTAGSKILTGMTNHFLKANGGAKLTDEQVDLAIAALKRHEQTTSGMGMFPHLGEAAGGLPMGLSDILASMPKAAVRKWFVGNAVNQVRYKTLLNTVSAGLRAKISDPAEMRVFLKDQLLANEAKLTGRGKSPAFAPEYTTKAGKVIKNKDFTDVDSVADEIASVLTQSMPNFTEAAVNASKLAKVQIGEFVHAVSEPVIKQINDALDLNKGGAAIEALLNSTDMFRKAAKAQGLKNVDDVTQAARKVVADDFNLSPSLIESIEDGAKVADEMYEPVADKIIGDVKDALRLSDDPKQVAKVKETAADAVRETIQDTAEVAAKAGADAGDIADAVYDTAAKNAAGFMQTANRMFNGNAGMGDMAGTFHKGEQSIRANTGHFASILTDIQKLYPKEEIARHFAIFRRGEIDDVPDDLQKLFNLAFDGGKYGRLSRAGINPDDLRFFAEKNGVYEDMMPKWGTDNPWEDVKLPTDKVTGQPDILAYMKNMYTAQFETMRYNEMGKAFSAQFGSKLRQGKDWYKPTMSGDHTKLQLTRFLDPNKYYPKDILDGVSEMNRYIKEMDKLGSYGGEKMNSFMTTVKHITGKWKLWQTVVRPGHHVKNQVGDMTLTFLAGHTNPDMYSHSFRILKTYDKQYRGLNGLAKRMDEDLFGIDPKIDGGDGIGKTFKWGNNKYSDEEIHAAAMQENILTSFYTAEDLSFSGIDQTTKRAKNPLTKTLKGVEHVGGTISEYRDKHVRLTHFFAATRKIAKKHPNWSKSKVYGAAGAEVRRWHPNGTGLSPWENKYAKVGIMFYSWQRQVLPLMLESLALKPGRVTVAPKAMYAIAEANGIDLDSFGNPFPADNIYPEFLTDEGAYGPQIRIGDKEYGVKPGIPQMDFLAENGTPTAAINTGLGSVNPLVRAPIEFATGQRWGVDNIPITDKSEYVDQQIPLASYANNLTGRSLSSGFTQQTRKAEEGRNPSIGRTLANLLLGGGITDYTDPKFQEIAEKQLRERQGG